MMANDTGAARADRAGELTWDPPGPGSWQLLADHYPRPVTRAMEPFAEVWTRESTEFLTRLGVPVKSARMEAVNGLPYISIEPIGGSSKKPPPAWVLRIAVKVVPAFRRSERLLSAALRDRPWREGIARWYDVDRAAAIDELRGIARLDPFAMADPELADHVVACHEVMLRRAGEHMALHAHDSAPPGLFAARVLEWGLELDTAIALLAGASPASRGDTPELRALRAAIGDRPVDDFDSIRALGPQAARALDELLEVHGWRVVDGYDIDCATLAELPGVLVALVTTPPAHGEVEDEPSRRAAARSRVPEAHREEFDLLLDDARLAYGVRDDNSGILIGWPVGLLRRAMLAAGDRLVARGALAERDLALEADPPELAAALRDERPLDVDALADCARHRASVSAADAPRWLGGEDAGPPPDLPGALGLVFRALTIFGLGDAPNTDPLHGLGIGTEPYEGRARLVLGAGEGFDAFEPGDVLVAPMTSPSYNVLLALAGAVVTEEGAVMSHAAIMARELGLPAVVGAPEATRLIADGDLVRVDPVAGRVTVLAQAASAR